MTKLAKMIEARGTSIRQLARDSRVPERSVYRHVRGITRPKVEQAAAYARALDCPIEELVEA